MASVTRIFPPAKGGGGPVIQYTTFASPWGAPNPTTEYYFGLSFGYVTATNATFFVVDPPITTTSF